MKKLSAALLVFAVGFALTPITNSRELDYHDYRILAQETNGQCASPGGIGGCLYDSDETYYPESK